MSCIFLCPTSSFVLTWSDIMIVEDGTRSRAILANVGSAYQVDRAEYNKRAIAETPYTYPFVPPEAPAYNMASDIYNYAQLFMEVRLSFISWCQ